MVTCRMMHDARAQLHKCHLLWQQMQKGLPVLRTDISAHLCMKDDKHNPSSLSSSVKMQLCSDTLSDMLQMRTKLCIGCLSDDTVQIVSQHSQFDSDWDKFLPHAGLP